MQMPKWMKWAVALAVGFGIIALGWKFSHNPWLSWILPAFFVINCLVLIVVVLLQSGKAADLAGAFGGAGSQTAFGPRGAANALSSATTWCAVMFMVCALALVLRVDKSAGMGNDSILRQFTKPTTPIQGPAQKPAPAAPAQQTPAPTSQTPSQQAPAPQSQAPASQPQAQTPTPQPKQ